MLASLTCTGTTGEPLAGPESKEQAHTFCWSLGSRGPSRAAAMMLWPLLLLSSGATSGREGRGNHHSA